MASVAIHGGSATPVGAWYGRTAAKETLEEERESTVAGLFGDHGGEAPMITPEELAALLADPNPPCVLDVRTRTSYSHDGSKIPGSLRVLPDQIRDWAATVAADGLPDEEYVTYCS